MREACPLCGSTAAARFAVLGTRGCRACQRCGLVFVEQAALPTPDQELAQYRLHENDPDDPRYRLFLRALTDPLAAKLAPGAEGLDFGCGPGPAIAPMLEAAGFRVHNYDPFFAPDEEALARRYDFVVCTEVVEHLHAPGAAFGRLDRLLRPGGWLGVMTLLLQPDTDFSRWPYARDPTHVVFYSARTLAWIAERRGWALETDGVRIALFHKPG